MIFKDENLIKALSNKQNVKDEDWNEIQLEFDWNKLVSNNKIIDSVFKIKIKDMEIKDLSWIKIFYNLTYLDLSNNNIENITSLTFLKKLKSLRLIKNSKLWKLSKIFLYLVKNYKITDKWFNIDASWKTIIIKKV